MQQLLTEKEKKRIMQQLASPKNGTHLLTTDRLQPCGLSQVVGFDQLDEWT
jgi:hypothetical protein